MTPGQLPTRLHADEFVDAVGGPAAYDPLLEQDYELSRIAWLNCAAWDAKRKPTWVLKGGFAIRHTYQSERLSADVDLAPMGLSARGSGSLVLPSELRAEGVTTAKSGLSERHKFSFPLIVGTGRETIWSDVNSGRPVRLPPPQVRPFTSKFMDDFPVWVVSIEEIVGEKSNGLLSFAHGDVDRLKDAFDLWFLLSNGHADGLNNGRLQTVLGQLKVTKGLPCPTSGFGAWFRSVLCRDDASLWWNRTVKPVLRGRARVSFDTVRDQLPTLAERLLV